VRSNGYILRVAQPTDADAVTAVLASAYPGLLAHDYDQAVLAAVLPSMTTANPKLLASGTYYVQQTPDGRIVSCGGWTTEEPGTNKVEDGVAHLRHFATHVDWIKQGLGAGIFDRCRQDAFAAGVGTLICFSSLSAVAFYTSFGFSVRDHTDLVMRSGAKFPTVIMEWHATPDHAAHR
jgi:hypothetical protein